MNTQYALKSWLDEQNNRHALENFYDSLPEIDEKACSTKAQLTLLEVQLQVEKDIASGSTISGPDPNWVPF